MADSKTAVKMGMGEVRDLNSLLVKNDCTGTSVMTAAENFP